MKSLPDSAAPTALHRLWRPALAGLVALSVGCEPDPPPAPPEPAAPTEIEAPPEEVDEPSDEESLPVIDAALAAWSIDIEAFSIDAAAFDGDTLVIATATPEGPTLVRYDPTRKPGEATATPEERDRLVITREDASPIKLVRVGSRLIALWIAMGQLEALALDPATSLAGATPQKIAAEEGGAFAGTPVVASHGDDGLACLRDGARPLCIAFDERLQTQGLYPFERRNHHTPELVSATREGYVLVFGRCRTESCARQSLDAVTLDANGSPIGRSRSLPEIQTGRGTQVIETEDGLVLVARRVGAGEHSAWLVTPSGAMELDGRFTRTVGGFSLDGRILLVERAHLRMRKGFPVTGFHLRPLALERRKALRHEKKKVTRESFPEAIAKALPTAVDQTFTVTEDALLFATPRVKGQVRATVVRLTTDGEAVTPEGPGGT